jgi:hypothetical protein
MASARSELWRQSGQRRVLKGRRRSRSSPSAAVIEDYRSPVEVERIRKVLLWFRQSEERWKEVGHKPPVERRANSQGAATGGDHEPG